MNSYLLYTWYSFTYSKEYIKTKQISFRKRLEILEDIFGKRVNVTFMKILVNANNEVEFENKLIALLCKWKKDEYKDDGILICFWK